MSASAVPDATYVPPTDTRVRPDHEIMYAQSVGAEDVYLGMGTVDPSSASCNVMVIKIKLPEQHANDIDLDVQRQILSLQSAKYRLATYLPHPVDPDAGNAKWHADKEMLVLRLPIIRD